MKRGCATFSLHCVRRKKDKKKASQPEHENPFKQETLAPEQPVHKAAAAAPEHVPQQPSGGCTVVLSGGQSNGNVRTTIMGSGSGAESELYLAQSVSLQALERSAALKTGLINSFRN